MRLGGTAVLAALVLGVGGGAAQASSAGAAEPAPAVATADRQQAVRQAAQALLDSPIRYTAADRAGSDLYGIWQLFQ